MNGKYLLKIMHRKKIFGACTAGFVSLVALSYCYESNIPTLAFAISLIASLFSGISQALGEMTMLGITKFINPFCVTGFTTGTGLSGVFSIFAVKLVDKLRVKFGSWVRIFNFSNIFLTHIGVHLVRPHHLRHLLHFQ
jgi:hypothetical protein